MRRGKMNMKMKMVMGDDDDDEHDDESDDGGVLLHHVHVHHHLHHHAPHRVHRRSSFHIRFKCAVRPDWKCRGCVVLIVMITAGDAEDA